jgi:hypothetical protein
LDVPTILAQMNGDAVGTGLLGQQGSVQGIWIVRAARLAQRGYMIHIHTQFYGAAF